MNDDVLLELAEGRCTFDPAIEAHLAACADCRGVLAAAARGTFGTQPGASREVENTYDEPSWEELGEGVVVDGRYLLDRFLGAGGMGVVWSARRLSDDLPVALKVARSTNPELAHRFEREARIGAALDHPHVARTLDFIAPTSLRGPCLVQELLVGETLEQNLRRHTTLTLGTSARLLLPVVAALAAGHARGIVHRDLKPGNIFLTEHRVVVVDFGIAKLLPEWGVHSKVTVTGAIVGTPAYMAPEQLFGESGIDARVDVWALAGVLFRALTGRPPVSGGTIGEMMKSLRSPRASTLPVGLPRDVAELLQSALTIQREHRLADITRFADVLGAHAS